MLKTTIKSTTATSALDAAFTGKGSVEIPRFANDQTEHTNALGLESTAEFSGVSKIWQEKGCLPFPTFRGIVQTQDECKWDCEVPEQRISLNGDLTLAIQLLDSHGNDHHDIPFTPFGLQCLVEQTRMGTPWLKNMIDTDRAPMVATIINEEMQLRHDSWVNPPADMKKARRGQKDNGGNVPARSLVMRLRDSDNLGPDGSTPTPIVRAIVSDRYSLDLTNAATLDLIGNAFKPEDQDRLLVSHYSNDGDNMIGNILIPDNLRTVTGDSDYFPGVYIANSEIKQYVLEIRPFLYRAICRNGCVWGRRDSRYFIHKKHLGNVNMVELQKDVARILAICLSQGESFVHQMTMAQECKVSSIPRMIVALGKTTSLTHDQLIAWYDSWKVEGGETAFGLINGLTRAANTHFSGGERNDMEAIAGDLLSPSLDCDLTTLMRYWDENNDMSTRWTDAKVAQVLKLA